MFFGVGAVGRQSIVGKRGVQGASLDLGFMSPGVLDPRITFTRASTGTYFDSSGVMQTAATNIALWSGDISNAVWLRQSFSGPVVPTAVANQVVAPDGTLTAAQITYPAVSGVNAISSMQQGIAATASVYTYSMWLRGSVGGERVYLQITPNGNTWYSVPAVLTTTWQRFSVTSSALIAGTCYFVVGTDLRDPAAAATPAQTIYAWGGQVQLGLTATFYVPTTTAANGAPRWDYDPVTHALRGLLIEEARTNVWLQSADASNAAWTKTTITTPAPVVTANQITAPDGTLTAARVAFPAVSASGNASAVGQSPIIATVNPYSFSVWLKGAAGGEQLYLSTSPDGTLYYRTLVTLTTVWQRFVLATPNLTAVTWFWFIGTDRRDASQAATLAQSIYVWGAQVEQSAFPTSYIPTTAASVTRAADSCAILPANMGFYTPPGGSWMAEFIALTTGQSINLNVVGEQGVSQPAQLYLEPTNHIAQWDATVVLESANAITLGAVSKAASTWTPNTGLMCVNGGTVASGTLTNGYASAVGTGMGIMVSALPNVLTGYMRRVRYWPRVLTNAELKSVTT